MGLKSKSESNIDVSVLEDARIGIVTSKWNAAITDELKSACHKTLLSYGLKENQIISIDVPGSYELPYGARLLHQQKQVDAIICLGCVIKGETEHDIFINQSTAQSIQNLSIMISKPVIFGVLTVNTEEQAIERSGGSHGHKGIEAAETALELLTLEHALASSKKNIGFNAN